MELAFYINIGMAIASCILSLKVIPLAKGLLLARGLFGKDLNKVSDKKVPESLGMITGAIFLVSMFIFIPCKFMSPNEEYKFNFKWREFIHYLSALLSICCMIFLGFVDDVLNLRWRHKLTIPTLASLPLLMVYYTNIESTTVIVPKPLTALIGSQLDLGILYYIYMGMLAVFCTNAINILAGINGIEVGQSVIICLSIIVHNVLELSSPNGTYHLFSLYFMIPFLGCSLGLLYFNWCPASVFVGDTFCYFAGMTFAVVGILGHFSKTMLLFFMPQIFNFLYSVPQLFRFVHCPRHRLPKFNPETGLLGMSYARFKTSELTSLGKIIIDVLEFFRCLDVKREVGEDGLYMECNNMTIINFVLLKIGPTREGHLTVILMCFQALMSLIGLFIRYYVSLLFFDN